LTTLPKSNKFICSRPYAPFYRRTTIESHGVDLDEVGQFDPESAQFRQDQRRTNAYRDVSAAIAKGKRPVPYRTRKLSPSAPMVLPPPGGGRLGRRRTPLNRGPHPTGARPLVSSLAVLPQRHDSQLLVRIERRRASSPRTFVTHKKTAELFACCPTTADKSHDDARLDRRRVVGAMAPLFRRGS
jgi:hypothetical protein